MHLYVFVEDLSGKKVLDILLPKIIGSDHTFDVKAYRGIGHLPKGMKGKTDPWKRILLDRLPQILRGMGKTIAGFGEAFPAAVIVVCDLDSKCLKNFRAELIGVLDQCNPKPDTRFCIAVEEGEAWFLGDIPAIKTAYPNANDSVLNAYSPDSICGTWECLADAVHPGGAADLNQKGWPAPGVEKSVWAETISPHMDIDNNQSPSFCYFRDKIIDLITGE